MAVYQRPTGTFSLSKIENGTVFSLSKIENGSVFGVESYTLSSEPTAWDYGCVITHPRTREPQLFIPLKVISSTNHQLLVRYTHLPEVRQLSFSSAHLDWKQPLATLPIDFFTTHAKTKKSSEISLHSIEIVATGIKAVQPRDLERYAVSILDLLTDEPVSIPA